MSILLTSGTATGGIPVIFTVALYGLLMVGMYFLFMRPQSKEKKRIASMLASMEVGDIVLTTSGFYGEIISITEDTVIVEFGNNKNCRIPMDKSAISRIEKNEEQ